MDIDAFKYSSLKDEALEYDIFHYIYSYIYHNHFTEKNDPDSNFRFKESGNYIIFIATYFIELCLENTKLMKKHFVFKDVQKREIHKPLSIRQS